MSESASHGESLNGTVPVALIAAGRDILLLLVTAVTGHSLTRMPPRPLKSDSAASSAVAAPRGPRRALPGRPPRRPGAEEAGAGGVPRIAEARAVAGNLNLKLGAQRGGPRASG